MNRLYKEQERVGNGEGIVLKSSLLKVSKIHTFEQAVAVASTLDEAYNDAAQKYNQALKKISELQLQVVRLQGEKMELEHVLEVYQQTEGDSGEQ
jgi:exonuclease VII small subunit